MDAKKRALAVLLGALGAGCATPPEPLPLAADAGKPPARYALQSLGTTVTVSSTKNAYFPAAHLTDGKPTTAWAPAPGDAKPSIRLAVGDCRLITDMKIKASPDGLLMDVWVVTPGGDQVKIAADLAPTSGVMQGFDLPDTQVQAVILTFHGVAASQILVCEVQVNGQACPTPTPAPTATPTPAPTATPTPEPTATPSEGPCCKAITGNGNVEAAAGDDVYKFEINTPSGRVNVRGPGRGQTFLPILSALCTPTGAIVTCDSNDDGVADTTFVLVGEAQGNHLKVVSMTADGTGLVFPDFLTPLTDIQGSLNIFDDPDCDGTPNGQDT